MRDSRLIVLLRGPLPAGQEASTARLWCCGRTRQRHCVTAVSRAVQALGDILFALHHDLTASRLPVRCAQVCTQLRVRREADAVTGVRVERLPQAPEALRAHVGEAELPAPVASVRALAKIHAARCRKGLS